MSGPSPSIDVEPIILEIDLEPMELVKRSERTIIYEIQFPTWIPNHRHWVAPSQLMIHDNGDYSLFAKHIANMRRTGGIFDTGPRAEWYASAEFYNKNGSLIHTKKYSLGKLLYKQEIDNAKTSGTDSQFASVISQITKAKFSRTIEDA